MTGYRVVRLLLTDELGDESSALGEEVDGSEPLLSVGDDPKVIDNRDL